MTTATMTEEKLEIGRVIQETFAVLGRNFATFFVLALILTGLPTAIVGVLQMEAARANTVAGWSWFLVTGLISGVMAMVLQGALIFGTINDLNGRRVSVSDSLTIGLRNFLGLFAVSLLYGLAVGFGTLLLIVPGIMIAVAWCAAVPALIAERIGIMDTFGRSAQLTRGNRWRIFGLFLVYVLVFIAITMVVGLVAGVAGVIGDTSTDDITPAQIVINVVTNVISGLIGATGAAVLYTELRRVREGATPDALAAIFD
ncbi:glycerophosphoryl diester phosphodiesterase membrane domain-containing protein [Phenylobacterium sp.]|uniref:glycerophosphoryl diester phosphodiesterase membrane domain-containing protein n=1 Tax=Phenylobacterium sp. TaxID=1871053 RepID=UPI0035AFED9E